MQVDKQSSQNRSDAKFSETHIDTINQVFTLFRVNYHNQYYAAFADTQLLNQTKKLWLESLSRFTPQQILGGAKLAIERSDYLPTLHKMITYCLGDPATHGLPEPHQAYLEACRAGNAKSAFKWSHPAVYFSGRDAGWYYLSSTAEQMAFPVFKQHYRHWCEKTLSGEPLPDIEVPLLESDSSTPLKKNENKKRLHAMREALKI
ncbi:MAG: replication protein P [Cellvibrionaceae bacterium]